jgi:ectoine hydroxylase-related dioxygenase (phytanoyl-CoA dioxygenase family)
MMGMEAPMSIRRLTGAEREAYERDGFVVVPEVFPREECAAIDAEIVRIDAQRTDGEPHALLQLGLRSPITRRVCVDERLLTLVEELVHPGIAIYSAKMVPKLPGVEHQCRWHQDDAYYRANSLATRRMSIWLALQDSDASNGGVWFLPGSHRWGLQEFDDRPRGPCSRGIVTVTEEQRRSAVCPPIAAGSVALFDALTWHFSDSNRSDRVRRAFIVSYQDALAQGGNGAQWRIVRPAPTVAT